MKSIRVFLTVTLLAIVTLVNFAAALRGYQASMVEAEALLNQRMTQQFELLDLSLPTLAEWAIDQGADAIVGPNWVPEAMNPAF
ncbi:MAG: hypothetical protein KDI37_13720, partial [Xanthomonadales bacterium]|nr:hypothetical protein [Xanthomonadales bacterium]